ncbi:MAG TPA: glutathione S-transferase family protein [Anaeromyxobacteraceae bacterium]|nr:glutathione S-transferase family protein [Anaeromyxobacteraceae bacterium]
MELFYGRNSGNSARSVFALEESGVPFTRRLLDTRKGENRTADYLAVNPMGKIPALSDGAFRLWESNAINWYVAERHPSAGLLPGSVEGRAAVQRWLFFQAAHVSPACALVFRATNRRMQDFWNMTGDAHTAEAGRKELARWLPVLEDALGHKEWLEGTFSLGDIAYAPHLWLVIEGGFDFAPYPAVRAWLDRLYARSAWKKAAAAVFGA